MPGIKRGGFVESRGMSLLCTGNEWRERRGPNHTGSEGGGSSTQWALSEYFWSDEINVAWSML